MKKLNLKKKEIETLYWRKGMSLPQIGKLFNINPGTLHRWMKRNNIPLRSKEEALSSRRKVLASKDKLFDLYWKKKLSLQEIASLFNVTPQAISYWMKKFNIRRRTPQEAASLRAKIKLSSYQLEDLYLKQGRSINKIAEKLGVSPSTVRKYLIKFNIPRKNKIWRKYERRNFSGNKREKFYLIGLALGDLYVIKRHQTIVVSTTTTHPSMIKLFLKLFSKYGYCYIHPKKGTLGYEWYLRCNLDLSFMFLLQPLPQNLDDESFFSFLAGLSDAEGWWGVVRSHSDSVSFIFELRMKNKSVLTKIKMELEKRGFHPRFGGTRKNELYSLRLLRKEEVFRLAKKLISYSKHEEKIEKMKLIIHLKNKNSWKEIKNMVYFFKKRIKNGVKMCKEMARNYKKVGLKVGLESF